MRSARHALSALALATVALGGLTACNGVELAAAQAAARDGHAASASAVDAAGDAGPGTTPAGAPAATHGLAAAPDRRTTTPRTTKTEKTRPPRTTTAKPTTTRPTTTRPTTTRPTTTRPTTTRPTTTKPTVAPTTTRPPTTTTTRPPATTTAPPADSSVAGQILTRVNAERAQAGCNAVTLDSRLTAAAAGHAQDMATQDYFSHTSKDGRTFVDRIRAQGYTAARSENIAAGQPTVTAVMDAWMASPGHKANILDCSATQMGAASARGGSYGIYWVQDFGRG